MALLLSLIVLTALFLFGAAYLSVIFSESGIAHNHEDSEKAFFIAEAGIDRAIRLLVEDNSWRTSSLTENLTDGYYTLVVDDDPDYEDRIRITSTGAVGKAKRITRITLTLTAGFDFAIFAGDITDPGITDIDCTEANGNVRGDIHANGTAAMGTVIIQNGVITQGELGDPVYNNILIDLDFHRTEATSILPDGENIDDKLIKDELIYVEGDVTIDCSGKNGVSFIQSSLIAEGDIIITGANKLRIDEYNYSGYGKIVALATKTGNIIETESASLQDRDVKGLVFSEQGIIDFENLKTDAAVYGQNVSFHENLDIDYKIKRFPTVGFIYGMKFYDWEELF